MDKLLMYNKLQRKYSKPNFFSTPKLEKASWMLLLWVVGYVKAIGRGSLPPVGFPQSYVMRVWASVDAFIMAGWLRTTFFDLTLDDPYR